MTWPPTSDIPVPEAKSCPHCNTPMEAEVIPINWKGPLFKGAYRVYRCLRCKFIEMY